MADDYDRFVAARRARWERLEALLVDTRKWGVERMPADQVEEFGRLYRLTASDLALARGAFPRDRVVTYLNALVARAYRVVYGGRPAGTGDVVNFLRYGFPAAFRHVGVYTLLCFVLFGLAALISAALVAANSSLADLLLPGEARDLRAVMAQHRLWVQSATEHHSVAAGMIMTNNIQVAVLAFGGGMLLTAPTIYVMISNGINFGAVAALVAQYHLSLPFWSFVAPHGVIELSVIFASGGAGMAIGDAILRPGRRRRADAVTAAARVAARVLLGCAGLLVIAGTIEAYFSPSLAPAPLKFAAAAALLCGLYVWVLGSRQARRPGLYRFQEIFALDGIPTARPTAGPSP